jgi:ankyrin repeat protein
MSKMSRRMSLAMRDHIIGEIFQYLQEGEDVNAINDKDDDILILWAARHGYTDLINFLVNSGANIEVIDSFEGYTPLLVSILCSNYETFELLLKAGANPNHKTFKGSSAMSIATLGERFDIVEKLKSYGVEPTPTLEDAAKFREEYKKNKKNNPPN